MTQAAAPPRQGEARGVGGKPAVRPAMPPRRIVDRTLRLVWPILAYDIIQMNEAPVQVLKESDKAATWTSYLWVQRGGPPSHPIILCDYDPTRGSAVAVRLLAGFTGALQTDGYRATVRWCAPKSSPMWVAWHARRKFDEAIKTQGKHRKPGLAEESLKPIQKLYAVEKAARDKPLSVSQRTRATAPGSSPRLASGLSPRRPAAGRRGQGLDLSP